MASEQEVKQYLAYWFQLGKRVVVNNGQQVIKPKLVIQSDRYSQEFESCWQQLKASNLSESYLEGTEQSIAELLTPAWEMNSCARCAMPVPIPSVGVPSLSCPCNDLPTWPNTEVPAPRSPVNSQAQLADIRDRLLGIPNQGN
ncbi:hypothetical protein [Gloeocapsopsis dulcis]|uniref:Uncharacterized protein n=1 Tax=Gloeocapsopsis dulcis AAB1 = 1H9 TaxID=1433147 RepID=A0A6N8FP01_9CHRO|nr:hypothetical protein [Gloeocapsopsis dulcis]MUL34931.1 hypothetical protein [Gloeocapsopsis dulcis AAB1 = 1H9]WNN89997.1 hypothetical protein P0S91_02545 [Gloeocapsopsis dulcis]